MDFVLSLGSFFCKNLIQHTIKTIKNVLKTWHTKNLGQTNYLQAQKC